MIGPGLHRMDSADAERVLAQIDAASCSPFVLDGNAIFDHKSFYAAIRKTLPLDPPLISDRSWDALADSLFGGLHELPTDEIIIVWKNSENMANQASEDFEIALGVWTQVCRELADEKVTAGQVRDVCVIIAWFC